MDVWNAWRHRKVGGFISAGVRSVGTSDAVTVLRVSMHPSMRRRQGIRSLPALSRVRTGSSITKSRDDQGCGIASAAFASQKSARAWTRRKGASQLGIAPELAAG